MNPNLMSADSLRSLPKTKAGFVEPIGCLPMSDEESYRTDIRGKIWVDAEGFRDAIYALM
jgi:hypothetical protein